MTRDQDGAVAVEFVFIVPFLVMILFATVQLGLMVYRTQMIEASAREGARVASVGADPGEVRTRVEASAPRFHPTEEITDVTLETRATVGGSWNPGGCANRGDDVRVTVRASGERFNFDILFLQPVKPVYEASATFRCEGS